jgi:DNA polymerase-3 subunit alpha
VLRPDINYSDVDFSVDDGQIRFGLLAIKNVGRQFADAVVKERHLGKFKSFDEFVSRLAGIDLNKRTLESLIKCGVFDSLGVGRSSLLACYESIMDSESERHRNNVSGQMDLFGLSDASAAYVSYNYPKIEELSLKELLLFEKECSGMYFSGHMIDGYSKAIEQIRPDKISEIINELDENSQSPSPKYKDRMQVKIAGIISEKRTKVTKNGDTMAFIKLEDRVSEIEVIVFARQYANFAEEIFEENAVVIGGSISQEDNEAPRILLSDVKPLSPNGIAAEQKQEASGTASAQKRFYIKVPSLSDEKVKLIYRVAAFNKGDVQIVLFDEGTRKYSVMKDATVAATEKALEKLTDIFGNGNVVLK